MDLKLSLNLGNQFKPSFPVPDPDTLYDLLIIGAGPAGLNAALYAARKGLKTAVAAVRKGGRLLDTNGIDNYLGLDEVTGETLSARFQNHLRKYNVPLLDKEEAIGYDSSDRIHRLVFSSGKVFRCRALVIATGSNSRRLGVPGEEAFEGKGVTYCAICDAPLYIGKDVFVVGGGNSAVQAAIDLARQSGSVTLIQRSHLRADKVLVDQMAANPRIRILLDTRIVEITGGQTVEAVRTESSVTGGQEVLHGDAVFIEIGLIPETGIFKDHLRLSAQGEIIVNDRMETSLPGVFAAGDVVAFPYKQIIVSAGQGAIAALTANDYIARNF
ncbi:MAG: NAD(P)/FAD-dependent oxidoreductase [Saccharofermentanales bacterium]